MDIKIEVKQEIINGVIQPKKYTLKLDMCIPMGTGDIRYNREQSAWLVDLEAEDVRSMIPQLIKELQHALTL